MKKITIALVALFSNFLFAQDGGLDTTFGTNGYYQVANPAAMSYYRYYDGKFMYQIDNKIYRLNENGVLDTTFGTNGSITITQQGTNGRYSFVVNNNKIFAFSRNTSGLSSYIYYMNRYNMDGTPDTTLGGGTGYVVLSADNFVGGVASVADSEGYLICASTTYGGNNVDSDVTARKYDQDGVRQFTGFNNAIQYNYNMSSSSIGLDTWDGMRGVQLAPNGNMIFNVGMTYYGTPSPPEKYRSGYITVVPGTTSYPNTVINSYDSFYESAKGAIAIDADSNVYMLTGTTRGYNNAPNVVNIVYKRNAAGNLYNAFGTSGSLSLTLLVGGNKVNFEQIAVQPDGKLLLAGGTTNATSIYPTANMVLARFLPDGTLDTTFGTNGYILHDIDHPTTSANNTARAIVLSPDGSDIFLIGNNNENSIILKYSNPSLEPLAVTAFDAIAAICAGDTAPALQGISNNGIEGTWSPAVIDNTTSGTYIFTPNADEHATTATLSVTVKQPTTSSVTQSACENYTWSENGMVYTESGTYTSVSTNADGCSHTTTLNLTINQPTSSSVTASACDSYTWSANGTTYTESGSYVRLTTNAAGCVHTTTLNLTINNAAEITGNDTQTFEEGATLANVAVSPSNVVWYASLADAQIGENPIAATTELVNATTYYAVNFSAAGCPSEPFAVTVTVTLGTGSFDTAHFRLYPNPTSGLMNIQYTEKINSVGVFNLLGQQVMTRTINANDASIDVSKLSSGTYFVKVATDNAVKTVKIIKQ